MGVFSPSFLLGLIVLLYLSSFVVFALLRIATGISIQRIGYFSLRRIAYTPRDGIRIDIRGLGLHLHRPTFAQPTWISLRLTEFKVTVDVKALNPAPLPEKNAGVTSDTASSPTQKDVPSNAVSPKPILRQPKFSNTRSRAWKKLTQIKERIKRLHEKIHWLKLVDVVAMDSSFVIAGIGSFEVGTLNMVVDTRRKTVDRGRLFQHKKVPAGDQWPAEWMFTMRGLLFTPEGKESLEVVDICSLNIHGLLYRDMAGLRDSSISLKLGRVRIPYDDLMDCYQEVKDQRKASELARAETLDDISIADVIEELEKPGSREAKIVQTVSDSKEFVSSILRGVQEIQIAVSFVGLTKEIRTFKQAGTPVYLNLSMNEFGIDMHRLDPKSPAHRMYFAPKDIAHQALMAAISIGISLDDGRGELERLLYIPMATTTIKTTLPSKTVAFSEDKNAAERNANILFANQVVTSPSIDLDPKHMPLVLALLNSQGTSAPASPSKNNSSHRLFSRLLPKANINFSIHEPVMRVALPPSDPKLKGTEEYDLLICAVSSISLNAESSHSSAGELHYALTSNLRVSSNQLYYQTAAGDRYDLLLTEALEVKVQVSASPEVCVVATGDMQTFSVHLVRPEISNGLRQIVQQISKRDRNPTKLSQPRKPKDPDFLRPLPPWLVEVSFRGSNFGIEIAGVDQDVSQDTRGVAFQLESWTADYKLKRDAPTQRPQSRRTVTQKAGSPNEPSIVVTPPSDQAESGTTSTDGRRLAIHVRGFEGFVVEGIDVTESESFIALPRFEVAFSTASDHEGSIFHVHSFVKALYLQYSLYRYYAFGVASKVIQKAFAIDKTTKRSSSSDSATDGMSKENQTESVKSRGRRHELVSVDIKNELFQIKAKMPSDPPMMLQILGIETGRHRWAKPFFRSQLIRVFAETPRIRNTWTRIISVKSLRADLREIRKKRGTETIEEKSFDVATDFIRVGVPHQLVVYKIFDNLVNVAKASQQLHHRFHTGTNEYILEKKPEGPKELPRVSIRSKALLFDIEDGPFDWKLSTIYRVGLIEQKQRLAREEAFAAKSKHVENHRQQKASARLRGHGLQAQARSKSQTSQSDDVRGRAEGTEKRTRHRSLSPRSHGFRSIRYDPEGQCSLSQETKLSSDDAWWKLQRYNAQSWKKRIDGAYRIQHRGMREIRGIFWGNDQIPEDQDSTENILAMPDRPGLMTTLISDLHVTIDKPSFPVKDYAKFLHSVGKGMPVDMQYSLLIPMNVQLNMGEARVTLRDYPLPLLHVPAIRPGQSPRLPSWSLKSDFVIAEEFRGPVSTRHVSVEVVPGNKISAPETPKGFAIDVRRTVSPVKTYSDVDVSINTSGSTKITWGTSYQPAIQDMMMVVESFTRPQVDPSSRVGFWDKIRLSIHSRVLVSWKGDGDVHLQLKGTRDPYIVTSNGAGFVMVWRDNVRWSIHKEDDPKKFMTVDSGEYALAIPDYSHQAREANVQVTSDRDSISSTGSQKAGTSVRKTIMKLSGNVRWLAGLVFERDLDDGGRSFDFRPHYDVTLTTPENAKAPPKEEYDAFKGFRSNHIHLSIAVAAPMDRDWSTNNAKPALSYNSVHLTPRFFTHFFDWWSLFSGAMSLPIRQGKLFPGPEKSSKKFGRHLATIKYNLLLSPLFIAHVYKHKDAEDYTQDTVSATGLKLRLDSFMLDLHQRREEFAAQGRGKAKQMKATGMKINQAQLDLFSADIRAVSANITGTSHEDLKRAKEDDLLTWQQNANSVELAHVLIPDEDKSWVDADDFVELGWILPSETDPPTSILPLAYAPRFTYFRQTDHGASTVQKDETRSSPFGDEPTHFCVMTRDNDPRKVQRELIQQRIEKLEEQMKSHQRTVNEQELHVVRDSHRDGSIKERYEMLKDQGQKLEGKRDFLVGMVDRVNKTLAEQKEWESAIGKVVPPHAHYNLGDMDDDLENEALESAPMAGSVSDFNNRFIVHNMQLKWNNSLRNIILRYAHQVSQRRGFVYYLSRRAVKFILDIVEEQSRNKKRQTDQSEVTTPASESHNSSDHEDVGTTDPSVEERINELLNDGKKFVDADDPERAETPAESSGEQSEKDISSEYKPLNTYFARMIAPQIQFQSEKNPKSVLLVTAKSMQLKVIQIMDKERMADDVSGLVQRRFSVDMDSMQFFVTTQKIIQKYLHLHSANRYGSALNSSWPPWVPFEVNFDFEFDPFGWSRVVQRTSASLRYEKYNTLRLKYNDELTSSKDGQQHGLESRESRVDHLWVEFPQLRAICDSIQYYTMYVIVLDLLLYNEPLEKVRSEKLEKIMLASDFSDLRGAPEMVVNLQARIRQLEEIKTHFQIHAKYLDRQGWQDHLAIEEDLASCEDELFFMMKAITTSQRKVDDRSQNSQTTELLRWYISASEIVWHLMHGTNDALAEVQLNNAVYNRTDNTDGSNHNKMEIERMHGLNLLPNAIYPEMLGPYFEGGKKFMDGEDPKMLKVVWHSLEAIAGIPVLDQFEVDLYPLRIQLEREIGQKLFEYVFPGVGKHGSGDGSFSPMMAKQAITGGESDKESDTDTISSYSHTPKLEVNGTSDEGQWSRPNSLDMRVRATTSFPENHASTPNKMKRQGTGGGEAHHFRLFHHSNHSSRSQNVPRPPLSHTPSRKPSVESLNVSRHSGESSSTNLSALNMAPPSHKRGFLKRNHGSTSGYDGDKDKPSDDLSQMLSRASNYMTLSYVKIPSVVLCLSYKGKGERNIEDVHNFVFRMPNLEYRNKTWSNLDLALRLKKDVIRALISHTGAIIGNKFSHHRPSKFQQSRLRELASSSILLPNKTNISNNLSSETSSLRDGALPLSSRDPSQASVATDLSFRSPLARNDSFASSLRSQAINGSGAVSRPDSIHEAGSEPEHHDGENALRIMRANFTRRFTGESLKTKRSNTAPVESGAGEEDNDESNRKKSVLLLGKKILGSLN